ncbi:amidohydrolase family protein [Pacificibacter marinus]|uniref:amidohydrolase family protein n=1 Tax=Pacificibacter marinus TaxID=658057 RepID=UPI001C06CF96|nr:amidohydrolase family protein [Pacificibacter marinus]MBU2867638.1 amidohydrolase family protein [Pacificibacter marinus]
MIIDAHQHFWKVSRGDYSFPRQDDLLLYRDFLPQDLVAHLHDAGVAATIVVQATETITETEFLLRLAQRSPFIVGVIGWCDLRDGVKANAQFQSLLAQGPLVGIRPMLQAHNDASWLLSDDARPGLNAMVAMGLSFDALVDVRHLDVIDRLATIIPNLRIIVNHLAKPWRNVDQFDDWQNGMRRLSRHSNCWVKLSGVPAMDVDPENGITAKSLIDFAVKMFGTERLVWGSDWPVSNRQGVYRDSLQIIHDHVDTGARRAVFSGNAKNAYKLKL